ncbi:MAG TPA: hypothetical protein VGD40_02205 [Chryseosolibacter sp.]
MLKTSSLIICFVVAILIFAALLYVIWINRTTDKTVGIFFKAIAGPLLVAVALLLYEFAAEMPTEKTVTTLLTSRDRKSADILNRFFSSPDRDFQAFGMVWELNDDRIIEEYLKERKLKDYEVQQIYFDRAEIIFFRWLIDQYPRWYENYVFYSGFTGGSSGNVVTDGVDTSAYNEVSDEKLRSILSGNLYLKINHNAIADPWPLRLPPGSELQVKSEANKKLITIKDKYIRLSVQISGRGGGLAGGGPMFDRIKKDFSALTEFRTDEFEIQFTIDKSYARRWSPGTVMRIRWANDLIKKFREQMDLHTMLRSKNLHH